MNAAATVEPIEMPFRTCTRVGPMNLVFDGGPHPSMRMGNLEGWKLAARSHAHSAIFSHPAVTHLILPDSAHVATRSLHHFK